MSTEPGSDPIGDFQRWLMKAGAKSIGREVAGRVKSTIGGVGGGGGADKADVWETATTEEPTDEPPECQWCPICRAARRYRDSGGTSGSQFAGVGDTLAGLTRDAFSLFDAALRASQRPAPPASGRPASQGAHDQAAPAAPAAPAPSDHGHQHSDHSAVVVGPGIGWPTVVHPQHEDDEATDERGDREEGGEPGDGGADGGADQQVERTAE
jgi:hypothetical protein